MANPLVSLGTLNRLRASVSWATFPALNVTASYLGRSAIRLALEGQTSKAIEALTGIVQSPEAYQMVSLTMELLKSQALSNAYKAQIELSSLVGNCTVRPDATPLAPYQLLNMSVNSPNDIDFSGESASFTIKATGYYLVNSNLWGG